MFEVIASGEATLNASGEVSVELVDPDRVPETATITSKTGVRFLVRILRTGDRYGLDDCLTWGIGRSLDLQGGGIGVEFYDTRHNHTRFGQFVSRYGADTILESTSGLDLMSYEPSWKIDAAAMDIVRQWLRQETGL
jgi:hypothetical protein